MAKHFGVTESYLKLWLNKDKPLNGWFVKEVNYGAELERLQ
nr:MAG TPA: helix-turn-helix domain protein [Caudoviricetes sp.]